MNTEAQVGWSTATSEHSCTSAPQSNTQDQPVAKIWDHYPTKDEVTVGVFIVRDTSRRSYEGRYVVAFRPQDPRFDHIVVAYSKQANWAQYLAPFVASDMGVPVVFEQVLT